MKTSFRYEEKESAIHELNPLVKLVWAISATVIAIILNHPVFLLALFLATLPMVSAGKIWRQWAGLMQMTLYLCLTITLINVLVSYHGTHVLWQANFKIPVMGYPSVTLEALLFGVGMSLRLLTIISVFGIVTLTVHPDDILQAMLKIKIPRKSVMVVSLATRFLPVLMADAERIGTVQQSRGLQIECGNLIQRIKNRTSILIPLLSNSLDRTVRLAEAMESRAFGSGRTRVFFKPMKIGSLDWLVLTLNIVVIIMVSIAAWQGWTAYQYYPTFDELGLNTIESSVLAVLLILIISIVPAAWVAKRRQFD
jgi:energy-coupling factor transport system permease protein